MIMVFLKRINKLLLAFLIIDAVINFALLTKWIHMGGDNQQLMMLGKSIYQDHKYSLLNLPGEPAANLYPPLYPAVIASALFLTQNTYLPDIIIPLKILNLFFFLATLIVFYFYLTQKIRNGYIIAIIIALTGLSVQLSYYINEVLTEIPYLFLSMLSVYYIDKYSASGYNKKYLYIGILFSVLCFYAKTMGIALLASIVILLLFHKLYKEAIKTSLIYALFIFPWFLYGSVFGSQPTYLEQLMVKNPYNIDEGTMRLTNFIPRIADNAYYYAQKIPEFIVSFNLDSPIIFLPLLLLIFIGFLKISRKKIDLLHLYIPLYLFILFTWPWTERGRFLIPVLPFLIYFFVNGCAKILFKEMSQAFHNFYKLRSAQLVIFSFSMYLLSFIVICPFIFQIQRIGRYLPNKDSVIIDNELNKIVDFINEKTPKDSVIAFRKPYFIYFYTERKSVNYPFTANKDKIKARLQLNNVSYIVDDNMFIETKQYLQPVIEELIKENKIELVYKSDPTDLSVYKYRQITF